mmetsp:Transcript_60245/g.171258  ORF Transcript_60245/g.171258 Transcript_60245/m.171258 type:complete len:291 (+) Transcript_60245:880-1752(+)
MRTVPIKEYYAVGHVQLHPAFFHPSDLAQLLALVIFREVVELATLEITERLQHGGAHVVPIAVDAACVVLVDVDRCPGELLCHVAGGLIQEPLAQEPAKRRVVPCLLPQEDMPGAVSGDTDGVAVNPSLALAHHVLPRLVLPKAPEAQHAQQLVVRDLSAVLAPRGLENVLCLLLCHGAAREGLAGLPVPLGVPEVINVFHPVELGHLKLPQASHGRAVLLDALLQTLHDVAGLPLLRWVHFAGETAEDLVGVAELVEVLHFVQVEGLVPKRTLHAEVSFLVVEQDVLRL